MKNTRRDFIRTAAIAGLTLPHLRSWTASGSTVPLPVLPSFQSDLKLTGIETFTKGNITLVRATADDGSQGIGQLAPYHNGITAQVLHEMIAPLALGTDPYDIANLADQCIETNYKFPWSFTCRATSGMETALWDLMGRREKRSVCELLGGKPKAIPVYGSSMSREITPKEEGLRMARLRDTSGIRAFKIRVGKVIGHDEDQWPGRTEEIIPAIRTAVGPDITLFADANGCYTVEKAVSVGRLLEDQHYYFFEEPCPFWELEWTAEVNERLVIPVAGGEQDNDMAQWNRLLTMNAVDIAQPDVCYLGGFSRAMKVALMAHNRGKKSVPHSANLSMLTVFASHLMATIPNPAPFLEFSIEDDDWVKGLFLPALQVRNGSLQVPEGPGWGVDVNVNWLTNAEHKITKS